MIRSLACCLAAVLCFCIPTSSWAAHPLITDDTGTQGTGKFELEVNGEMAKDDTVQGKWTGKTIGVSLAAGVREDIDIIIGAPYQSYKITMGGATVADEQGPGDVVVEAKWRFHEQGGFSLALKPGVTLPTGDEARGLGAGKTGYSLFLIATKEAEPVTLHANAGYLRNENNAGEEKDLWHLSLAAEFAVAKSTRIVGNIGMEKNPDPVAGNDPAFGLIGIIHSIGESIDLDAGVKFGLNDPEVDIAYLAGVTVRF